MLDPVSVALAINLFLGIDLAASGGCGVGLGDLSHYSSK